MPRLTKKAAQQVTTDLDSIANTIAKNASAWGIPAKIANDFAYRCDLLSDALEKMAGASNSGWDPEQIGVEQGGPQRADADEGYMPGEFSQQENRELREKQEGGGLGMSTTLAPRPPSAGKQADIDASTARLAQQACDAQLSTLGGLEDALKRASVSVNVAGVSGDVTRLASAVGSARDTLILASTLGAASTVALDESARLASTVNEVLPYLAVLGDTSKTSSTAQVAAASDRIGRLIRLAVQIADDCGTKISASAKDAA